MNIFLKIQFFITDYKRMWQQQTNKLAAMDNVVRAMLKPDERQKIRELRRRLHTKRTNQSNEGSTLYERIMLQRKTGSVSNKYCLLFRY